MRYFISATLLSVATLQALDIQQVVQETLQSNPKIQTQLANYNAIAKDLDSAHAGYYPELNFTGALGPEKVERDILNSAQTDGTLIRREAALVFTENIWKGGATQGNVDEQRSRINSASYQTLSEANNLSLKAITTYINLLRQKKLFELSDENVKTHERILDKIKEKTNAGLGKRSDVEQTQGRYALAYANYYADKNNFQDAYSQFVRIYGKEVNIDELDTPMSPTIPTLSFEQFQAQAYEFNPSLLVLQENIDAQKSVYEQSKASFYPELDGELAGNWNQNIHGVEGEDDSYSAMLRLRYNLFRGGSDEAQRVKNQILITRERSALNDTRRDVNEELKLAMAANEMIGVQKKFLQQHSDYTKKTAASYAQEYNLGRRTLIDLLNAELEYNSARQSLINAQMDQLLAQYRILAVTGQLLDTMNSDISSKVPLSSK